MSADDGMGVFHFEIGDKGLPPEPLWEVEVEEKRKPETVRAPSAEQAKRAIRNFLSYTPVSAERVDEDEHERGGRHG